MINLVPPRNACGILSCLREGRLAGRGFLLLLTSFAVLILTACRGSLLAGFRGRAGSLATGLRIAVGAALATVLVVAAAVLLIVHTIHEVSQTREREAAIGAVRAWAVGAAVVIARVEIRGDLVELELVLDVPPAAAAAPDRLAKLVPEGMTLPRLQELLAERLQREVAVAVHGQIRLAANTLGRDARHIQAAFP
jgi:hypothetical protein